MRARPARQFALFAALTAAVVLPGLGKAQQAQKVGEATMVYQGASRTPPGGRRLDLWPDYPVYFRDTLRTLETIGALHVEFSDGTELRMGEGAAMQIDAYVYDPGAGAGEAAISVSKGLARFVTGKLSGPGFRVRTPTALIGIRGTDFSVWVEEERGNKTTVWVNEGEVEVTPLAGGPSARVRENEVVAVEPGSQQVLLNVPEPVGDRGLGIGIRLEPPRDHHN